MHTPFFFSFFLNIINRWKTSLQDVLQNYFYPLSLVFLPLGRQKTPSIHKRLFLRLWGRRIYCKFAFKFLLIETDMKIGEKVKDELFRQGHSAMWLAEQLHCERTNVYDISKRNDMGVELLRRISMVLNHDFFSDLSKEVFGEKAESTAG